MGCLKLSDFNENYSAEKVKASPFLSLISEGCKYDLKDHLGNIRVTIKDDNGTPLVISATDYYPFGLEMPGRQFQAITDEENKHKFLGKELDYETGYTNLDARLYDRHLGRFLQVDPLSEAQPNQSAYQYSWNNPINLADASGLYPYTFHVRSFAPFKDFGGGFHGDNRGYSTSTDSRTTSRVQQQFTLETDDGSISGASTWSNSTDHPAWPGDPKTATPSGSVSATTNGDGNFGVSAEYAGSNPLMFGAAPDINVFSNFSISENRDNGTLSISGKLTGDNFPSTEAFIKDASGASVFLGVGFYEGSPFTSLFGENKDKNITSFNITLTVDKNGNFTGVNAGGKNYTIAQWNKLFTNADPHKNEKENDD